MLSEVNVSLYSKTENSKLNIILNVVIAVIAALLIFEVAFSVRYSGIYVIGPSMETTLHGAGTKNDYVSGYEIADIYGDYVYVDKYAKPERGDIVVAFKHNSSITIIKRVIALEGDCIKIEGGRVYLRYSGSDEFQLLDEPYVNNDSGYGDGQEEHVVAEGCMYLLGDHRGNSSDSRVYGDFSVSKQLYGVVTDWSLNSANRKFFTALHKYFSFDLPACFGIDNRVKTSL